MNAKVEVFLFFFFFFGQLIELFHRTMKKLKNPAEYELFFPKP